MTKEFKRSFPSLDFLDRILNRLYFWKIDLKELGADTPGSDWRNLRPYGCNCWGTLSPKNEMELWYFNHAVLCLEDRNVEEITKLESQLGAIIIKEGKRFKSEKEQSWTRIKQKAQE